MTRHKSYFQAAKMQKTGYRSFPETAKVGFPHAHFKWGGRCCSRLNFTFDLSPWPRIWSFPMTLELWPWIKTIVQWDSWRHKSYFRPPKCIKLATGRFQDALFQMRRPVSFAFDLDLWPFTLATNLVFAHDLWTLTLNNTIGQWGSWLSINRIFKPPKCRNRATHRFTKRQKYVYRTPISNEDCVIRVWPWPFTLATNLVFSHDLSTLTLN